MKFPKKDVIFISDFQPIMASLFRKHKPRSLYISIPVLTTVKSHESVLNIDSSRITMQTVILMYTDLVLSFRDGINRPKLHQVL